MEGGVSFPLIGHTEHLEMRPYVVQAKRRRTGLMFPHKFQSLLKALPLLNAADWQCYYS